MNVCPVLVGREKELAALEAALDTGGGIVLVSGEAGIGKTRLVREFAARARDDGCAVVWAHPEALAGSAPYAIVIDLLDDLAAQGGRGHEEARQLAESLGDGSGGANAAARAVAARVRGALSARERTIVIVEDLHHADELSLAVVAHLARSARDDGLLYVATHRSEFAHGGSLARMLDLLTRDRIETRIDLRALTRDEIVVMVAAMWGRDPADDDVGAIARLAEGIPFFVEEIAAARAGGSADIPETIARAVEARMAAMDEKAHRVMRVAALMDGAIEPDVLAEASGVPEPEIPGILVAGARAGILADREGRLTFRHALVRESLVSLLVSVERAHLHGKLAAAIERKHGRGPGAPHRVLGRHWREAGDRERAAGALVAAGRAALAAGAVDEANAALAEAQELGKGGPHEPDALASRAEVFLRLGSPPDAAEALRTGADLAAAAGRSSEAGEMLRRLAEVRRWQGDRSALDVFDEARALAAGDPRVSAHLVISKGYILSRDFNEPGQGAVLLGEGLRAAEALGDLLLRVEAHEGLAWVAELTGDLEGADRHGALACRLALEGDDDEQIGRAHSDHALRLMQHGRFADALEHLDQARGRWAGKLTTPYVQSVDNMRAWVYFRMGMPAEGETAASRLEATRYSRIHAGLVRVWAAGEMGDDARADRLLSAWWAEMGDAAFRSEALRTPEVQGPFVSMAILAELTARAYRSTPPDAELLGALAAYDDECRRGAADTRLYVTLLRARTTLRAGDHATTAELLDDVASVLAGSPYPPHAAVADEVRGELARAGGDPVSGVAALDRAAETLSACGNASDMARCLRAAAEAAVEAGGDAGEAVGRLRRAREAAAAAGAARELNRIEAQMRALGVRPRAGRPKGPRRAPGTLSAREQEVAALVAAGATNGEIAARLFLSERTVQDHISAAQRRLAISGRAALAAWAAKQGLV